MTSGQRSGAPLHPYHCTTPALQGRRLADLLPQARSIFRTLERRTKRRPYVRSAYFKHEKIFFDHFWEHLQQKLPSERARRLRLLPCALELLRHTRNHPLSFEKENDPGTLLHRFAGHTPDKHLFYVQIKQDKRSGARQLLSIFPAHR